MSIELIEKKKRILLLGSLPASASYLKINNEFKKIKEALGYDDGDYDLIQEQSVNSDDLYRLLANFRPNIVHFSGHGNDQGIYLEDSKGRKNLASNTVISEIFEEFKGPIECVIFNSCLSSTLAELISSSGILVVGTVDEVNDDDAINFSLGFYYGLKNKEDYYSSFRLGVNKAGIENFNSKTIPRIFENGTPLALNYNKKSNENKKIDTLLFFSSAYLVFFYIISFFSFDSSYAYFIAPLIVSLVLFKITSLEILSRVFRERVQAALNKFYDLNWRLRTAIAVTIVSSVLYLSFPIANCKINKYLYINNIEKLSSKISKHGLYESRKEIFKLSRDFPQRKDFYLLLSRVVKEIRGNSKNDYIAMKSANKMMYDSIVSSSLNGYIEDVNKIISALNCCLKKNLLIEDPIVRLAQILLESGESGDIFNEKIDDVELFIKTFSSEESSIERKITGLQIRLNMLRWKQKTGRLKNIDVEIKYHEYNKDIESIIAASVADLKILNFKKTDQYFYALDSLATFYIYKCDLNKATEIYNTFLSERTRQVGYDFEAFRWYVLPEKYNIYQMISNMNGKGLSNKAALRNLNSLEYNCPEYKKKIFSHYSFRVHEKYFIPQDFVKKWDQGTVSAKKNKDDFLNKLHNEGWFY